MERTDPTAVLIVGASGRTGRHVVRLALERGLRVRALTSVPANEAALHALGVDDVVVGDLRDESVSSFIASGMEAVFSAVGGADVFLGGVIPLIKAAAAAGVAPFVLETSLGCGNSRPAIPPPVYEMLRAPIEAMNEAEAALRASGLPYTIVRPGGLTDDDARDDVMVGEGGDKMGGGSIPRADVAKLMVAASYTPAAWNRTFELVSRSSFRGGPGATVDVSWRFGP